MKRSIKGHEDMTHAGTCPLLLNFFVSVYNKATEIMDILMTKQAQSPPPASATRPHKKINSVETIADSDDEVVPDNTVPATAALEANACD